MLDLKYPGWRKRSAKKRQFSIKKGQQRHANKTKELGAPFMGALKRLFSIFFLAVLATSQQRAADKQKEAMRSFLKRLVAEGGASWCEKCDGASSVWAAVSKSTSRFELRCDACSSTGVVNVDSDILQRLQEADTQSHAI